MMSGTRERKNPEAFGTDGERGSWGEKKRKKGEELEETGVTNKICRRDPTLGACYRAPILRTVEREINNTSYHKEMQFIYHTDKL